MKGAHRVRERAIRSLPVLRLTGVALGQRGDVVALPRRHASRLRDCLLRQLVRLRFVLRGHRSVDVGSEHERLSPYAIAQDGSSRAASAKARPASAWLKP